MALFFKKGIQDIPMTQEAGRQYLPWIIGLLILLLLLVFSCASSVGGTLLRWYGGLNNKITIEIPFSETSFSGMPKTRAPANSENPVASEKIPTEMGKFSAPVQQVLSFVRNIPGVLRAEVVEAEHLLSLLQPWIGQTDLLKDLQMPILIDLDIDPNVVIDYENIKQYLKSISGGIRFEAHTRWQHMLTVLGQAIKTLSYVIVGFILGTIFIVISLITKSSLAAHKENIDVLRLMGAKNSYVASQFQAQAFKACFQGGLIGIFFALPILYFLSWLAQYLGIPEIFKDMPSPEVVGAIFVLPFIVSLFSTLVSRFTVLRTLARMDR
jgi:cell division transport system permease protein